MEANTSIKFIEKTIEKTKSKNLSWKLMSSTFQIKMLPEEQNQTIYSVKPYALSQKDSYVSPFESGYLMLLAYAPTYNFIPTTPPDGYLLSLRMQDDKSRFSVEIAHTSSSDDIATALIRLYNLVDKDSSSVNILIDNFLNS